eukprot:gene18517-17045_t
MATAAHEKQEEMEFLILASGAVAAVAAGVATVAASVVAIFGQSTSDGSLRHPYRLTGTQSKKTCVLLLLRTNNAASSTCSSTAAATTTGTVPDPDFWARLKEADNRVRFQMIQLFARCLNRPGGLSSSSSSGYITLEQHHQPEDEDDSDTGSDDGGALDPAIFNGSILAHVEDDGAAAVVEKAVQAYASALGD